MTAQPHAPPERTLDPEAKAQERRGEQEAKLGNLLKRFADDALAPEERTLALRFLGAINEARTKRGAAGLSDTVGLAGEEGELEAILERIRTAPELLAMEFPEPSWVVPGYLSEGLTIIGGKPKVGKSWLTLELGIAVATGGKTLGHLDTEQGEALILALEDTPRRLQDRLDKLLAGSAPPKGLYIVTQWPRYAEGGLEALDRWLKEHPAARLVVVDTLQRVRPPSSGRKGVYEIDYEAVTPLKTLADKYGVAVVPVHHLSKRENADDPLDLLSGSTGLTGAADSIWILNRGDRARADAVLHVTGRDLEDTELALTFDGNAGTWVSLGDAAEFRVSEARAEILRLLKEIHPEEMRPHDIAKDLGRTEGSVRKLLREMVKAGDIRPGYTRGTYRAVVVEGE